MELSFDSKLLRHICEDAAKANELLGDMVSKNLQRRLADLRAAKSVKDLIAGQPGEVTYKSKPSYKINLCEGYQIVFCNNHVNSFNKAYVVDWGQVTRVKILAIEKTKL